MFKECIVPEGAAEIMGAYSHGLKVDIGNNKEMIFVTGQIAQDSNGNVVCEDIEGQTEYVFNCIQKILKEADSSKSTNIFDRYKRFFKSISN